MIFGIFVFSLTQIPYHRHSVIWSSLLFRAPPHSLANSCIHLHPSTLCATATSPVFCLACHWYHSLIAHMCCQKTKKCCPCCGHKKQLPAVLDPSLLPPTITCSHLRLPFDPSPFPLKSTQMSWIFFLGGNVWRRAFPHETSYLSSDLHTIAFHAG